MKCVSYYLDDYKISKVLSNSIKRMKKLEYSEIFVSDPTLVKFGEDFDILMKKLGSIPEHIVYKVKCYYFTEGKSTFNMTIEDKIEAAIRIKAVGLRLI